MATVATYAEKDPERVALIFGNGETVIRFGELEQRSRRMAHLFRRLGLGPADCVALLMGNEDPYFDIFWGCHRTGLYLTPVNWHLQVDEVEYIVRNSDAKLLVASAALAETAARVGARVRADVRCLSFGGGIEGFAPVEDVLADVPEDAPLEGQLEGSIMFYSSGTTGRPKGVRRPLVPLEAGHPISVVLARWLLDLFGINETDRYLCPGPLYHAAPLGWTTMHTRIGASAVVMRRFDPEQALRLIQDQKVTSSQWVPTHFQRLLQLPPEVRRRYDLSSLRVAVHAAAPCPVPVKRAMIEWWGDRILEYYAGTEGGGTMITAREWLEHPGSVGRHWQGGKVWILDEEGHEVAPGQEGGIYFEPPEGARFQYYKDEDKTRSSYRGDLFTLGDIGYLDGDGYLFLTDRKSHMIISGGVNIYPQETENHLCVHPKVQDVAVIGVPNEEMGEEVKAVVVPAAGVSPGPALEAELIAYCREGIAHYKCPRTIDFVDALPRTETGKMAKHRLKARYWGEGRRI